MNATGCVVVGRNEAPRLRRCLDSVLRECRTVVYVDSASTDESVSLARKLGVDVVTLDGRERLSAARARNAGFYRLLERAPELRYVQFVDGDSELHAGWLEAAQKTLENAPHVAAVSGRLRERNRGESLYNRLCDLEWATPVGDVAWTGGIVMLRALAFREVGGFDGTLIAGEEPDLCARLRDQGWRLLSLDVEMALHDAAMTRFSQWWRRNVRAGYAYAEAKGRRPDNPAMDASRQVRSIALWGLALPGAAFALALPTLGTSLAVPLGGYAALAVRIYRRMRRRGLSRDDARLFAVFCALGKLPQGFGLARYEALRRLGRRSDLIEHKAPR